MCTVAVLLPFALLITASEVGDKNADMKRLQGVWVVDPAMYKDLKDEKAIKALKAVRVTFKDWTVTFTHPPANEEAGSYDLEPTKSPKQIDLMDAARGIYELDGDTLKLCWDQNGKTNGRPKKFANDKEKPTVNYLLLRREKE